MGRPASGKWRAEPRSEPDSGHPTVRDRRGALGDVTHGEPRNPTRKSKERLWSLLAYRCARPGSIPTTRTSGSVGGQGQQRPWSTRPRTVARSSHGYCEHPSPVPWRCTPTRIPASRLTGPDRSGGRPWTVTHPPRDGRHTVRHCNARRPGLRSCVRPGACVGNPARYIPPGMWRRASPRVRRRLESRCPPSPMCQSVHRPAVHQCRTTPDG